MERGHIEKGKTCLLEIHSAGRSRAAQVVCMQKNTASGAAAPGDRPPTAPPPTRIRTSQRSTFIYTAVHSSSILGVLGAGVADVDAAPAYSRKKHHIHRPAERPGHARQGVDRPPAAAGIAGGHVSPRVCGRASP